MVDSHANFAYSTVAVAPSPATSGTSLEVVAGEGAVFPTPPFNVTVWPIGVQPLASNAEIVRVTGIATDTFTIARTQEGSSARAIQVGDQIAATITVKTLTDVEAALNSFYVHVQAVPAATWNITHGLGFHPSVTVVDSLERVVIGSVEYLDENTAQVSFIGAFSGKAYLS